MTIACDSTQTIAPRSLTDSNSSWHAFLRLKVEKRGLRSALTAIKHCGPLYVQKPFFPEGEDLAHIYVLHPPGGLVSGDALHIEADLCAKTRALLTSPGAGRAYRSRADGQLQKQSVLLRVAPGASIEWLPQENIIYPGAQTAFDTTIQLSPESHLIAWDITSLGLPARKERFDHGRLTQTFSIWQNQQPQFFERFILNDTNRHLLHATAGLQGFPVQGLFVAGPFSDTNTLLDVVTQSRALLSHYEPDSPVFDTKIHDASDQHYLRSGITSVGHFFVMRSLSTDTLLIKNLFLKIWQLVRPALLQRPACPPRIWAT